MFKKMLKVLRENYKIYITCGILGFIFALIIESVLKADHIIISAFLLPFAHFCGCWFIDIRNSIYSDDTVESKFVQTINFLSIFFAIFLLVILIVEFGFGYEYAIIRLIIPFSLAILVDKLLKLLKLK